MLRVRGLSGVVGDLRFSLREGVMLRGSCKRIVGEEKRFSLREGVMLRVKYRRCRSLLDKFQFARG